MLWVSRDLQQSLRCRTEEETVDDTLVLQRQGANLLWQRKDHMKVLNREKFRRPFLHPLGSGRSLALRAVAVAARVVSDLLMAAVVASLHVTARAPSEEEEISTTRRCSGDSVRPCVSRNFGPRS